MRTSSLTRLCADLGRGVLATLRAALLAGVPVAALAQAAAPAEKPQYGGTLTIANVYYTISALSWDSADFNWKHNVDTGLVYEQLFAGNLDKSVRRGGKHRFKADAYLLPDAIRGELAESWEWKENPLRVELKLRKGVMFPEKPGVMASRELTAEDVVFSYERLSKSPKKIPGYFDHLTSVEAKDRHTVVFNFKEYNSEWDYRFGYGYYSAIVPKEVAAAGAGNWKNINGTGPYQLVDYQPANSFTFAKNPVYWDSETIGGQKYKLPFADKIVYRNIKDASTVLTALRTGKIDVLEALSHEAVQELKRSAPKLKTGRHLSMLTPFLAMRMDTKPFDDVRVRRALNMAINRQELIKAFYNGEAEILGYPLHPDYAGYWEPLSAMPDSVKELFTYDPVKAKKLLAEAGHPNGFSFKVQYNSNGGENDLLTLVAAYLEKVGVKMEMQPMEYGAFLSAMTSGKNAPGYFMGNSPTNPTTALRKQFVKGQMWNPAQYNDPDFSQRLTSTFTERDEEKRKVRIKVLQREVLDKAPYIFLPTGYGYVAWWPWVKNYEGELRAGAVRPGPIHARIWIDQDMKKKMGF